MATAWLPDLPGFSWGRTRSPKFNTLVQTAASGLEVRQAQQTITRREWSLDYSYLRENAPYYDVETMEGFYIEQLGPNSSILFWDQYENQCTGQFIATGDGVTTGYQLQRTVQGADEPVFVVDTRGSATYGPYTRPAALVPVVFINGTPVTTVVNTTPSSAGAAIATETGILTLGASAVSSASGQPITATFSYGFRVRFEDDQIDFDNVFGVINSMKGLKLIQTRV